MTRDGQPAGPVPAAIVLYRPDLAVLDAQLSALDRDGRRLFLFGNGELDAAVERRLTALRNAVVLRSPLNLGQGAALNALSGRAIEEGFAHLLLLDQDSEPDADLPERLLKRVAAAQKRGVRVAAVGPLLVPPDRRYRPIRYAWLERASGEALFIPTSGSLLPLAAFAEIGPFRADYFIGGIDVEWGIRATHLGFRSSVATDLSMVHRWGSPAEETTRRAPQVLRQSPLRNYYYIRNAIDCLKTPYAPLPWRLRYGANLAGQVARLLVRRGLDRDTRSALHAALRDGIAGRLGPAPSQLLEPAAEPSDPGAR